MADTTATAPAAAPAAPAAPATQEAGVAAHAVPAAPEVAPATKPENADLKHAQLQRRLADQERAVRKQANDNKLLQTKLAELEAIKAKYDSGEVADYDKLTERILKGEKPQAKDEKALSEVEKIRAELAKEREERNVEKAQLSERENVAQLAHDLKERPEFAHVAWMGGAKRLHDECKKFEQEHGDITPDDRAEIAMRLESEISKTVAQQLREGVKSVPGLKKLVLELAKELAPASETQPGQRESQDQKGSSALGRSTTLPSQASSVSDRAGKPPRSDEERKAAALARIREQSAAKH